ncbi:GCF1 [Candida pseudojiufengensis]|uniref:GCF1 n=1 Tax=Candida pseudojiufengensis TaxID=497109 RepID=UPI00222572CE|nr:GCF1 [Candida pseudojiufengensis]KAI5960153.1 GCF1 [Candida pseudojiufengensis]
MFRTLVRPIGFQLVRQKPSINLWVKSFTTTPSIFATAVSNKKSTTNTKKNSTTKNKKPSTSTTKKSKSKAKAKIPTELRKLQIKLTKAKLDKKKTESKLKAHETNLKKLIRERTKKAKELENSKLSKAKELKNQKKLLKDALRDPRTYTVFNFYSKITKTPISILRETYENLPSYEQDKWQEATTKFNELLKKQVTPKPKLGPTSKYQKFVSENYPSGESSSTNAMKSIAEKWKNLTNDEKNSFEIPEDEKTRIKTIQKDWQNKRLKEYPELIKFKKEYTFDINA